MFGYELGENTELRLLEERHAEQLANLNDPAPWASSPRRSFRSCSRASTILPSVSS